MWEGRKKGARGAPWDSGLFPAMAVVFQGGEAGSASGLWGGGLVQAEKHTRRCSKATVSGQSCVPESPDWGAGGSLHRGDTSRVSGAAERSGSREATESV